MPARPISPGSTPDIGDRRIPSGIAPLDEHLGGLTSGRIHLLSGGIGTGKTSACLQFIAEGLRAGETAAFLTLDEPAELGSHTAILGIDLAAALRARRLVLLRYGPEFSRRFASAGSGRRVIDDLRRMFGTATPPERIAVDPLSPFLSDGSPSGLGVAALVEFLDSLGATSLLTCGNSLTPGEDRRLDPVVDRAAMILSLERGPGGSLHMNVSRARFTGAPAQSLPFSIVGDRPSGPAPLSSNNTRGMSHGEIGPEAGPLTIIAADDSQAPDDLLALLRSEYRVATGRGSQGSPLEVDPSSVGILVGADHETLSAAHELVQRFAHSEWCPPIIVALHGHHRSLDRARLLRSGADEVLAADLGGQEFLQRLATTLSRGHDRTLKLREPPTDRTIPELQGFTPPRLRAALLQALTALPPPEATSRWSVLALTPRAVAGEINTQSDLLDTLQGLVRSVIRVGDGDRCVAAGDSVVAYLHEARPGDAEAVVARIRRPWKAKKQGPLRVQLFGTMSTEVAVPGSGAGRFVMSQRFHYPAVFGLAVIVLTVGTVLAFGRISEPFLVLPAPDQGKGLSVVREVSRPGYAPATAEELAVFADEDRMWRDSSAPHFTLAEIRARGDGRRSPRQAMQDRVFEHTRNGNHAQAIAELERWVAGNSSDEAALLSLARLLATAGRTDASVARYRQLLELQSGRRR